jgi:hypothetical protein
MPLHPAQRLGRGGVAGRSGGFVPFAGLRGVLRHAEPEPIEVPEPDRGGGPPSRRCLFVPLAGLCIALRNATSVAIEVAALLLVFPSSSVLQTR